MVGTFSDITMFSFDPVKTITSIDGGALIVNTQEEKKILHELRLIGMTQPSEVMYKNERAWTYDVKRLGFRYHLSNIHAAVGIAQLNKIEEIRKSRVDACMYYSERLGKISQVRVPISDFSDVLPFLYYIRVPSGLRSKFREFLLKSGVDTGIHWQADCRQPAGRGWKHCSRGSWRRSEVCSGHGKPYWRGSGGRPSNFGPSRHGQSNDRRSVHGDWRHQEAFGRTGCGRVERVAHALRGRAWRSKG
jgi:dTDP-4-amino-4,6-dideoxygalactose transaminase